MKTGPTYNETLVRVEKSGRFTWPWPAKRGLAVVVGGHGGGGGGGGAMCIEGLNVYGAGGGGGGGGGEATFLEAGERRYIANGGNGGGGGAGGGIRNGKPLAGKRGTGCLFGESPGGTGGRAEVVAGRITARGGDGGAGFPGETVLAELEGLEIGEALSVRLGAGGAGGEGGDGFEPGQAGVRGPGGYVLLAPLLDAPRGASR